MVKIEFWNKGKDNVEVIRRYTKEGYRIVCDSKGEVLETKDKVCILWDPLILNNPKRVNELCKELSVDSIIYILMAKQDFLRKYPYQKFKLPI